MTLVLSVLFSYFFVALFLAANRVNSIVSLHDEYQMIRAREQKSHIKNYAFFLAANFKSDLLWPVTLAKKAKPVINWIRAKQSNG